jgi:protein gp37
MEGFFMIPVKIFYLKVGVNEKEGKILPVRMFKPRNVFISSMSVFFHFLALECGERN